MWFHQVQQIPQRTQTKGHRAARFSSKVRIFAIRGRMYCTASLCREAISTESKEGSLSFSTYCRGDGQMEDQGQARLTSLSMSTKIEDREEAWC